VRRLKWPTLYMTSSEFFAVDQHFAPAVGLVRVVLFDEASRCDRAIFESWL